MPLRKQIKVRAAESMDAETFRKHVNARHAPIAGLAAVGKSNVPGDENEDLLRSWHDAKHRGTEPIDHYHEPFKQEGTS